MPFTVGHLLSLIQIALTTASEKMTQTTSPVPHAMVMSHASMGHYLTGLVHQMTHHFYGTIIEKRANASPIRVTHHTHYFPTKIESPEHRAKL